MTTITLPRAVVEQALHVAENAGYPLALIKALRAALAQQRLTDAQQEMERSIESLKAALAQQAEPTVPSDRADSHQPPGCDHCNHPLYAATRCRVCGRVTEQAEPVSVAAAMRDARLNAGWGSPPQQAEPACPDCHGVGYDASGQTCACQENPSF